MGKKTKQAVVTELPESLDIAHAAETKAVFQQLLESSDAITLDGGKIIRTDAAGLQLLLAFQRQCESEKREIAWSGASEVLLEDVAGLGLARHLVINPQP